MTEGTLAKLNAKLDRVKIRQKGSRLYLRATLPPKDGQGIWKQYDVRTGCPATPDGYKSALGKAQKLESDLIFSRFSWSDWIPTETKAIKQNCESAITAFEKAFWESRKQTPSREGTYYRDYGVALAQLPLDEPLTGDILKRQLLKSEVDTRTRERNWNAYTALAKFADIELPKDWRKLKGNYQPKARRIPSEQEILEVYDGLYPGKWKWAYGIFAAYGLRNHEIVRLDLSDFPILKVLDNTKTQSRLVYPLHKDWPDRLKLHDFNQPELGSEINTDNGQRVCQAFTRNKIPFSVYALRDAYAIRATKLGISPAIVAKWMGHSLSTHYKHYLRHIEQIDFDSVWDGLK